MPEEDDSGVGQVRQPTCLPTYLHHRDVLLSQWSLRLGRGLQADDPVASSREAPVVATRRAVAVGVAAVLVGPLVGLDKTRQDQEVRGP